MRSKACEFGRARRGMLAAPIAALGLSACTEGQTMGKMVWFSAVRGTVLQDGKPVAGAFALPAIVRNSFLGSPLPHEPLVKQTIITHAS